MKIDELKDLAKLIALCRKTGVQSIRVDGIELHLGDTPGPKARRPKLGNNPPNVSNSGPDEIDSDTLTAEQLLMWSVSDPTAPTEPS